MTILDHKIDFAVVLSVRNANPNGDPLNGNRPRQNYAGYGEISDVCLKRKIRNRLQDMGESLLVQSDERRGDSFRSIKERVDANAEVQEFAKGKKPIMSSMLRQPVSNGSMCAALDKYSLLGERILQAVSQLEYGGLCLFILRSVLTPSTYQVCRLQRV